jgi:hypothetical protein
MDNEIFLHRLQQLVTIKPVKAARDPGIRPPEGSNTIFRNGTTFEIDKDSNSTLNWAVKSVNQTLRPCDDCGQTVNDRRINVRVVTFPERHWRRTCNHCRKTWNPETGQYDLTNASAQNFFVSWLKRRDK